VSARGTRSLRNYDTGMLVGCKARTGLEVITDDIGTIPKCELAHGEFMVSLYVAYYDKPPCRFDPSYNEAHNLASGHSPSVTIVITPVRTLLVVCFNVL
jgi:hypothetical protein